MKKVIKNELEKLTEGIIERRKNIKEELIDFLDSVNAYKIRSMISDHIIPFVKDASIIIGRSGCSLNYYSNELAVIRDPKKRIFIQILFYPYGHSKITL